jgi:AcrR family transcriptional regulator
MEQLETLRDRKKFKTRQMLIATAADLFLKNGFENTTVDEIAEAADISRRTFFRYFATKEAVVFPNHENRLNLFKKLLKDNRDPKSPYRTIRDALMAFAEHYVATASELLIEWKIVTASPILIARDVELDYEYEQAIAELLKTYWADGSAADRRANIMAGAIFGAIRANMREWFTGGCKSDLVDEGKETLRIFKESMRDQP